MNLARFDSKLQQRGKLQRTGMSQKFAWSWIGLAFMLLLSWLIFHYILRPEWLRLLPSFFSELHVFLLEAASTITLAFSSEIILVAPPEELQEFQPSR